METIRVILFFGFLSYLFVTSLSVNLNTKNEKGPRIPKCCPYGSSVALGQLLNGSSQVCRNSSLTWTGFLYDKHSLQPLNWTESQFANIQYVHKTLNCESELIKPSLQNKGIDIKLLSDGTAVRYCKRCPCKKWRPIPKDFCIDGLGHETSETTMNLSGNEDDQIVGYCPEDSSSTTRETLYTWMFFISSSFYLITAIVYAFLWKTQNIHGWTTFSLVSSRFLMCISLGIAYMFTSNRSLENTVTCIAIGVLAHFFMLASFTWLVIINFDFWVTFRTFKPMSDKSGYCMRLLAYQVFAWGFPALIVGISLTMDKVYSGTDEEIPIPDYGNGICFVTPCARGPYIYHIIAGLLTVSMIFSTLTFMIIFKLRRESEAIRQSKNTVDTKGYLLYTKLSLVMGITWMLDFVSWASTGDSDKEHWIWILIDVFNLLITAILIFLIFICKRNIIAQLERKCRVFEVVSSYVRNILPSIPPASIKPTWYKQQSTSTTESTSLPFQVKNTSYLATETTN